MTNYVEYFFCACVSFMFFFVKCLLKSLCFFFFPDLCLLIIELCLSMCVCAHSCPTVCDPMDCNSPGASVHGIFQEYWSGLLFPPPGDLPDPGFELVSPVSPAWAGGHFTIVSPAKPQLWVIVFSFYCQDTNAFKDTYFTYIFLKLCHTFSVLK